MFINFSFQIWPVLKVSQCKHSVDFFTFGSGIRASWVIYRIHVDHVDLFFRAGNAERDGIVFTADKDVSVSDLWTKRGAVD